MQASKMMNGPSRKLAAEEQVHGAYGAKKPNVHKVHEDLSTGVTTQLPSGVEFPKKMIIYGGSRSDGNTMKAIKLFDPEAKIPLFDLSKLNISFYDYDHKNQNDDYIKLMEKAVECDTIILSTPIHWYNVSGRMKIFLDRLTDLLYVRKDLGHKLAGKKIYILVSFGGVREHLNHFEAPFIHICDYMKMLYGGCFYYHSGNNPVDLEKNQGLVKFRERVLKGTI